MCSVWIWEQTAIILLYSINWLVFITETECVYCAVRSTHTVYLCVFCGSENKQRLFHGTTVNVFFLLPRGCLLRGTFCAHSVFMCFVWIWEQTAIISLYSINWLVFVTETECVYCAVRSSHTVYLCFLCGSENKQRLFLCTALTEWFL
jgi:predicted GNAT family N-acyltransferase